MEWDCFLVTEKSSGAELKHASGRNIVLFKNSWPVTKIGIKNKTNYAKQQERESNNDSSPRLRDSGLASFFSCTNITISKDPPARGPLLSFRRAKYGMSRSYRYTACSPHQRDRRVEEQLLNQFGVFYEWQNAFYDSLTGFPPEINIVITPLIEYLTTCHSKLCHLCLTHTQIRLNISFFSTRISQIIYLQKQNTPKLFIQQETRFSLSPDTLVTGETLVK